MFAAKLLTACHRAVTKTTGAQAFQVRFARKTFRLQSFYGIKPLYTDQMYKEAVDQGRLEELSYQKVRFARTWETNSPLQDDILEKYLRFMLFDGRRHLNYELLHQTLYEIKTILYKKKAESIDPIEVFHKAVENCKPLVVTRKVKRGGATYQVPYPVSANESEWMAMRWLNKTVKERPKPRKRHYYEDLAQELIDASNGRGKVVKMKDDLHKLALSNKAYAHYRWG